MPGADKKPSSKALGGGGRSQEKRKQFADGWAKRKRKKKGKERKGEKKERKAK